MKSATAILASLFLAVILLAQRGGKPRPKLSPEEQQELRYACTTHGTRVMPHKCSCPMMVVEHEDEVNEKCGNKGSFKDEVACRNAMHQEPCDVVRVADTRQPAAKHEPHTCSRSCSKERAACLCHADNPPCIAPPLIDQNADEGGN